MLRRCAGYSGSLLEKTEWSMRVETKGQLGDFQEVASTGSCCSWAGSSRSLLEMLEGRPIGSRSDLENDLLMKNQGAVGA